MGAPSFKNQLGCHVLWKEHVPFLTFHADLATPFPLTQHTDYSSSVILNMLLCSFLYFLYLNFLKAKAVFYSPWKSSKLSSI